MVYSVCNYLSVVFRGKETKMQKAITLRKTLTLLLAVAVAVAMIVIPQTMTAHAGGEGGPITKTVYITKYGNAPTYFTFWDGKGGKIKSVKSSKKSVVEPIGKDGTVKGKKPGKAKLTFKVKRGSKTKTLKCKVIVSKYKNPFKKITVDGKDLTSRFKSNAWTEFRDASAAKVKIHVTTAKGWKVTKIMAQSPSGSSFKSKKIANGGTIDTTKSYVSVAIFVKKGKVPEIISVWLPQFGDDSY
jgi:hypothetical protein